MIALTGVVLGVMSGWTYMFAAYVPYAVAYHVANPSYTDPMWYFAYGLFLATFHGLFYGVASLVGAIVFEAIVVRVTTSVVAEVAATVLGGSAGAIGMFFLAPPWIGQPWGPIYVAISGTLGMSAFAVLVLLYRGKLRLPSRRPRAASA
jgi:hypothetical protein